ncbi:MAG: GTP-binding protein [Paenibacillaceae bacterium]
MSINQRKKPVTIVSGFLGSGKTTLLTKVLQSEVMRNTAIFVNEFGKVGLDHHLLQRLDESTVLLGGGCVCCTRRVDLLSGLQSLLDRIQRNEVNVDRVIIETTGLADPSPILFTVLTDPVLQHHYYIDQVVVTVDTVNGHFHLDQQPESIKQISAADQVVLTKVDIADEETVKSLKARIVGLNPTVLIHESVYGDLALDVFSYHPGIQAGRRPVAIDRMTEEQHIEDTKSISITFDRPIDWHAFGVWLSMLLYANGEKILRVKGLLDVGEDGPVSLNGVQHIIHPPEHLEGWPDWDHRSHIVFICRNLDPEEILVSLKAFQQSLGAVPRQLNFQTV